jgi:hypothetical protein
MRDLNIRLRLIVVLCMGLVPLGGQVVAVEIFAVEFDGGYAVRVVWVILLVELLAGLLKALQQTFQILRLLLHLYKVTNQINL